MTRFITAFNGARDLYMLPLALHEQVMLETHLTDFYAPDWLAGTGIAALDGFHKRRHPGLPFSRTSFVPQAAGALLRAKLSGTAPDFEKIDKTFGEAALKAHDRTGADLFLHSGYAADAFAALQDRGVTRCLFQFHPHALSSYEILRDDYEKHPEVAWSFANEEDTSLARAHGSMASTALEWQLADRIYAASSFTKQTLVTQGCDPDKIVVSPYGADTPGRTLLPAPSERDFCHFLFVGQGVQRKGIHHLLHAWRAANLKRSRLTIVARRFDPGLVPLLDHPAITFLPGVDARTLENLYDHADVFAMPSIVEGFGLVYLEALARGLFCIGTANTGLPDLDVGATVSRTIVPGDVEALVHSLVEAEHTWSRGGFDRQAIARSIAAWSWRRHRRGITDDLKAWLAAR